MIGSRYVTTWTVAVLAALAGTAGAASIPLGTAVGGVAVHYNSTGGELPTNQAYLKAQFSATNANGSTYDFDTTPLPGTGGALSWFGIFQSVPGQFGLDVVVTAPTSNNSVPTPPLIAYENTNGTVAGHVAAGPVTWAINGYQDPTVGPGNPANGIVNSLFRGGTGANDGIVLTVGPPMQNGTMFTVHFSGQLISDNLVHWYNPATPNSPVSNFQMTGKILFDGDLTYDSATDTTPGVDFYAGTIALEAEVICGTRYVATTGSNTLPGPAPNVCRNSGTPCATIQQAVDVACPGDTIEVAAGTYPEQVKISKDDLTVHGAAGGATIAPTSVVTDATQGSPCSNGQGTAIVLVSNATGVTLQSLHVDGGALPPGFVTRFVGIYYRNASGSISGGSVLNIRDNPLSGVQGGVGIYAQANGSNVKSVDVDGVTVAGYQKNGITFNGCGCADALDGQVSGVISNNTITGAGPTALIAQNGIQVGFGAGPVSISGNTVSGNYYTGNPANGTSAGILMFSTKNNTVSGNRVSGNNTGVDIEGGSFGLCLAGDSTGNALSCNRIFSNDFGFFTDAAANPLHNN